MPCGGYEDDPIPLRVHDCSLDLQVVCDTKGVVCICHHYLYQVNWISGHTLNLHIYVMKKYNKKVKTFLDDSCCGVNLHFSWTYEHIECTPNNSGKNGTIGNVITPQLCSYLVMTHIVGMSSVFYGTTILIETPTDYGFWTI